LLLLSLLLSVFPTFNLPAPSGFIFLGSVAGGAGVSAAAPARIIRRKGLSHLEYAESSGHECHTESRG